LLLEYGRRRSNRRSRIERLDLANNGWRPRRGAARRRIGAVHDGWTSRRAGGIYAHFDDTQADRSADLETRRLAAIVLPFGSITGSRVCRAGKVHGAKRQHGVSPALASSAGGNVF